MANRIIVIVEPSVEVEGEHHTYQLNDEQTPQEIFDRWKEDRSYRMHMQGVKIFEMVDITKTINK